MRTREDLVALVAPELPLDPLSLMAARDVVDRRVSGEPLESRLATVRELRPRRRLGATLVAAATAAVALVLGPAVTGHGDLTAASAASEVLLDAGAAAATQPGFPEAAYWHVVTESQEAGHSAERFEAWWARTGDSVLQLPGTDRLTVGGSWHWGLAGESMSWDDLDALPTDPDRLGDLLRDGMEREHAGQSAEEGALRSVDELLFERIGDTLRSSPASPALRAALWNVAATIPGVRLLGDSTDALGRTGVAVELGSQRLLVDPDTGELLEWYLVGVSDGTAFDQQGTSEEPKSVIARWTVVQQGPASSAPAIQTGATS